MMLKNVIHIVALIMTALSVQDALADSHGANAYGGSSNSAPINNPPSYGAPAYGNPSSTAKPIVNPPTSTVYHTTTLTSTVPVSYTVTVTNVETVSVPVTTYLTQTSSIYSTITETVSSCPSSIVKPVIVTPTTTSTSVALPTTTTTPCTTSLSSIVKPVVTTTPCTTSTSNGASYSAPTHGSTPYDTNMMSGSGSDTLAMPASTDSSVIGALGSLLGGGSNADTGSNKTADSNAVVNSASVDPLNSALSSLGLPDLANGLNLDAALASTGSAAPMNPVVKTSDNLGAASTSSAPSVRGSSVYSVVSMVLVAVVALNLF